MSAPTSVTMEQSSAQAAESEVSSLEKKIQLLTDLKNRVNELRMLPGQLLRPQTDLSSVLPIPQSEQSRLQDGFERVKSVLEKIRSQETQDTLIFAKQSEAKDKTGLLQNILNRHVGEQLALPANAPTPESPQPYPSFQPSTSSSFPAWDNTMPPLKLESLPAFIKEYNSTHDFRAHVWTRRQEAGTTLKAPAMVRFMIRDVLTLYISVDTTSDGSIITENFTAFGPREKKPPHAQSDYTVYQNLSRELAKMNQSQPNVPFQQMINLLESYADLFVRRCTACQRVVSLEGHVPPVVRVWSATPEQGGGHWDARHATCPRH